jgi:murein L,D-transpeptidase YcbB/YkuD
MSDRSEFSHHRFLQTLVFFIGAILFASSCKRSEPRPLTPDERVRLSIWGRLQTIEDLPRICIAGERIQAAAAVSDFYRRRDFRPAWSLDGRRHPQIPGLLAAIMQAGADGLVPEDYHLRVLKKKLFEPPRPLDMNSDPGSSAVERADLDFVLTDAFFLLASHLAEGKVDQDEREARWDGSSRKTDLGAVLERGLAGGELGAELGALLPQHGIYASLKREYARAAELAAQGGWPILPGEAGLKKGDKDSRVADLRWRLQSEIPGRLIPTGPADEFDEPLESSVCAFQQRHSLPQTGLADAATLTALNVPAAARARQIALNLERWRWLPSDLGKRYALIDVSNFEMFVVDGGREVQRMKIVAGTQIWPTPCFTSVMTDIVLNPSWNAPPRVLARELINYMKADPNYLRTNGMYLFRGWGADEMLLDPKSLELNGITESNLDFRLVQMPGPLNVLGRLKFSHPNRYDIYLHDTPYRSDFGQAVRAFSHGCIRIDRPMDFAVFLLSPGPRWTDERLQEMIDSGEERRLVIRNRADIHVFSGTAWPLADGSVHYRPDIYAADPWLAEALSQKPPAAPPRIQHELEER